MNISARVNYLEFPHSAADFWSYSLHAAKGAGLQPLIDQKVTVEEAAVREACPTTV